MRTADYLAKASAGHVPLEVVALRDGCGAVAISVWDEAGMRPLDHLVYDFAVGDPAACPRQGTLHAGADSALAMASHPDG